ncbi:MAG: DUF3488 domain-containing protein [Deltaproteobacteria bacterium]|nr:DUF3488 domain-containing protein [Deltaproteobacteria bacterium]
MNLRLSKIIAALSYCVALCGIVPLFPWLTTAPRLAIAAGMIAGIWQERRGAWPLKNWWLNAAVVPVFLFYAAQFSRANPAQPVVSVLAVMLAVRLGGEKSGRHYLQILALSLFCLAASSLFDLSPAFLVYLALLLLLVAVSLVLLTFHAQDSRMTLARPDLRKVLAAGLLMPLASLPLLLFFFPLLPRTQLPLWNILPPTAHATGFSDRIEPGRAQNVAESRLTVFRAEMPRLPQRQLYWRGTVFNRIVGNRWIRDVAMPAERIGYSGPRIVQNIYPEPGRSRALFALDAPAAITLPQVKRFPDGTFEQQGAAGKRLGYAAESVIAGILPVAAAPERAFYLRLPDGIPPRILTLAEEIRRRGDSDVGRLELLEVHFRNGNYRYTMQGLPVGVHALEQFLFEKKQGHCEFFASAFALLLRGAGVPARLVGGYLGGEYNELGGYYLISEDMAHVWVEAYIADRGWVRVDPSSLAQNAGAVWGGPKKRGLLDKFRLTLDSFNHSWNRTVITYDFERQVEAARGAGKRLQGLDARKVLKASLPAVLLLAGVSGAILLALRRKSLLPSREERLLRSFYRRLERDCGIGVERGSQGLFELATASGNGRVREFVEIYAGAVYRDRRVTPGEYGQLKRMLREGFRNG